MNFVLALIVLAIAWFLVGSHAFGIMLAVALFVYGLALAAYSR